MSTERFYRKTVAELRKEYVNSLWITQASTLSDKFNGGMTFNSRWLYPFAKLAKEQPENVGKFIFMSKTSWFKPFLKAVTINDCMKLATDPLYERYIRAESYYRVDFPQNLTFMRKSLSAKGRKVNNQLKDSLYRLFRTRSLLNNLYGYWDSSYDDVPYSNLDVFVKFDTIPKYPNIIKVCIGGISRYDEDDSTALAIKIKFYGKKEFGFYKDPITTFYKKLYQDKVTVFDEEELPWHPLERNRLQLKHIMSGYVDLDREKFLQETLLGKMMFSRYSLGLKNVFLSKQFPRHDLPKLETKMIDKFPNLMQAIFRKEIPREPVLL